MTTDSGRSCSTLAATRLAMPLIVDDASGRLLFLSLRTTDALAGCSSLTKSESFAIETVAAEAKLEGKPLEHHISHLVLHGLLHLLGHDHEQEADAEEMEALERGALARLAIPDPYA